MFYYPVILERDAATGQVMVTFIDIPCAHSVGDSEEEALLNGRDALETAFFYLMQARKPIPSASPVNGRPAVIVPVLIAAKVALHNAMIANGTRKADLARKMNLAPVLVDRLLSLKHKSRIDQLEQALALLDTRLVVDVV